LSADADLPKALLNVDAVIHLAGRAHVMHETAADPLHEFRLVNVGGTESLASIAAQRGVKRFIYVSSIKVNGEATNGNPFCADDPPGYCDSYGQSKWEAEERLRQIAVGANMEWVIVRPPLVYGPGVRGNFLALLKSVFRGTPLPVGSLHNSRSLVSVFNLSDFLSLLLDHPGAANNRFLVSDQHDISTPDLVRRVAVALHCPPRIIPCPEAVLRMAGTVLRRKAAIERLCSSLAVDRQKAKDILGWSATTTLDWGLDRTAEWFLKTMSVK
jgi:UDP-glucose 4-epimerase